MQAEMSLYDMTKQVMNNERALDAIELNLKLLNIVNNIKECGEGKHYWMLLCRERFDYTVCEFLETAAIDNDNFISNMALALNNRGKVLTIDLLEGGAYEIWIRDDIAHENFCYYFFCYDGGIMSF